MTLLTNISPGPLDVPSLGLSFSAGGTLEVTAEQYDALKDNPDFRVLWSSKP